MRTFFVIFVEISIYSFINIQFSITKVGIHITVYLTLHYNTFITTFHVFFLFYIGNLINNFVNIQYSIITSYRQYYSTTVEEYAFFFNFIIIQYHNQIYFTYYGCQIRESIEMHKKQCCSIIQNMPLIRKGKHCGVMKLLKYFMQYFTALHFVPALFVLNA